MQLRHPNVLMLERRVVREFSLADLLAGGSGAKARLAWFALAPHLEHEVEVDLGDIAVLDALTVGETATADALRSAHGAARIDRLVGEGLLTSDAPAHAPLRAREQVIADTAWWTPALVSHAFGRWRDVDISAAEAEVPARKLVEMIADYGPPPSEALAAQPTALALPLPTLTHFDDLLRTRATCRNYDPRASIPLVDLASALHRVFGAQATRRMAGDVVMLKKNAPSGGGLHPIEAFVVAQRVSGLDPGVYHYHSVEHVLSPMRIAEGALEGGLVHRLVAGQGWFADASALVVLVARFQRNFWKYRQHPKALRVIHLDAGHLSQLFLTTATELGHGAFVTGAINDAEVEALLGLDGLGTGAIAICGIGGRAATQVHPEFDAQPADPLA
jgi:putative peptide maturation dehydrogenase